MFHHTKVLLDRVGELQRTGHWTSAIELCEQGFHRSVAAGDVDSLIDSVISIGSSYRQIGDRTSAEEYYDLAYTIASVQGDHRRASRSLNGLAIIHQERGETERAEEVYQQALVLAELINDDLTTGRINQNLGTLSNIRGNYSAALKFYTASLECYERVRHEPGIAGVLNNLGMLHIDRRELPQAESCLDRALGACTSIGDIITEGIVHTNRTELLIAKGELDRARTSCDHAFEIASQLEDHRIKADALKFYGVIYRETGKPHLAEVHLRQAIAIASDHSNPLTEAECKRELALVLRTQERNREALQALNEAHVLFSKLRAEQDQADVTHQVLHLEEDFLSLVRVWGESIEAKDRYTRGHCHRVAEYACQIAEVAGISERDLVWFRMGAFLHDVGKTEVPEEILNKPGRLTDAERAIMERHTEIGDEMLAHISFPWDIRPMVRSHHERWDGRGYPDGLSGDAIPFTARILRIADVFDALTTTRSYRQPLSPQQAFQLMEDDQGSFDPDLFEIFRDLVPKTAIFKRNNTVDDYDSPIPSM